MQASSLRDRVARPYEHAARPFSTRAAVAFGAATVALAAVGCATSRGASEAVVVDGPVETSSASAEATPRPLEPRRAQRRSDVVRGALGVSIGEPLSQALRRVGGPRGESSATSNAYEAERAEWIALGYTPDTELPFLVGFDRAYTFNSPEIPVYMLFAKDGFVRLVRYSSFVLGDAPTKLVTVAPGCGLLSEPDCATKAFGEPLVVPEPELGHETHHYLEHGFSVNVFDGVIRVMDVYGELAPEDVARIETEVAAKASAPPSAAVP